MPPGSTPPAPRPAVRRGGEGRRRPRRLLAAATARARRACGRRRPRSPPTGRAARPARRSRRASSTPASASSRERNGGRSVRPRSVGDVAVVDGVLGLHARHDAERARIAAMSSWRSELRVLDRARRSRSRSKASSAWELRGRRSRASPGARPAPVARRMSGDERRRTARWRARGVLVAGRVRGRVEHQAVRVLSEPSVMTLSGRPSRVRRVPAHRRRRCAVPRRSRGRGAAGRCRTRRAASRSRRRARRAQSSRFHAISKSTMPTTPRDAARCAASATQRVEHRVGDVVELARRVEAVAPRAARRSPSGLVRRRGAARRCSASTRAGRRRRARRARRRSRRRARPGSGHPATARRGSRCRSAARRRGRRMPPTMRRGLRRRLRPGEVDAARQRAPTARRARGGPRGRDEPIAPPTSSTRARRRVDAGRRDVAIARRRGARPPGSSAPGSRPPASRAGPWRIRAPVAAVGDAAHRAAARSASCARCISAASAGLA